jgi:hypothetical protein
MPQDSMPTRGDFIQLKTEVLRAMMRFGRNEIERAGELFNARRAEEGFNALKAALNIAKLGLGEPLTGEERR